MIKYENECVDCEQECLYEACPYYSVPIYICDECGEEYSSDELYFYDDRMLCKNCLLKQFKTIDKCDEFFD